MQGDHSMIKGACYDESVVFCFNDGFLMVVLKNNMSM